MGNKKRVLVVDDAMFMRAMIRDILEPYGFEIAGEAGDGDEAVAKYKELKPDVVTLDIVMPTVSGVEALKQMIAFDSEARIVVISAIDQRELLMEAIRTGAKDFIVKPFEEERVLSAVQRAVE